MLHQSQFKKKTTIRKQLHGYKNKLAMYIQLKKHMTGRKKLIVLLYKNMTSKDIYFELTSQTLGKTSFSNYVLTRC